MLDVRGWAFLWGMNMAKFLVVISICCAPLFAVAAPSVNCKIIQWNLNPGQTQPKEINNTCKLSQDPEFGYAGECVIRAFNIEARAEVLNSIVEQLSVDLGDYRVETAGDVLNITDEKTNKHYLVGCSVYKSL